MAQVRYHLNFSSDPTPPLRHVGVVLLCLIAAGCIAACCWWLAQ
jgi:hypothetical protein